MSDFSCDTLLEFKHDERHADRTSQVAGLRRKKALLAGAGFILDALPIRCRLLLRSPRRETERVVTYDTHAPRALAVSHDERASYVAETDNMPGGRCELRASALQNPEVVSAPSVLHTFGEDYRGPHRVRGDGPVGCAFGGPDLATVYVTTAGVLLQVRDSGLRGSPPRVERVK